MSVAWWHEYAACEGTNDPVFFSTEHEEKAAKDAENRYCRMCPVRVICLESAIARRDVGVWAGTTTELRKKLSVNRDRKSCPGCKNDTLLFRRGFTFCTACGLSWKREKNA